MTDTQVVITGIGAVSAAGIGVAALENLLLRGGTALAPRSRAAIQGIDPGFIGEVPDPAADPAIAGSMGPLPDDLAQDLCRRWAVEAGSEAIERAGVKDRVKSERIALILGTNLEDHPLPLHDLTARIADELDVLGPRVTLSMACASSTAGFGLARSLLAGDQVDAVLVGGSDVLTPRVIASFRLLELLAARPCGAFGQQIGTSLGEGSGFVLLERHDPQRDPIACVLGEGLAADGYHQTAPDPRGRGLADACQAALQGAGLDPAQIDHADAHATGTEANDTAEVRGLRRVLGERIDAPPGGSGVSISAIKGVLGHAQGAAGVLELISTLLTRAHGRIPGNVGFVAPPRPDAPGDPSVGDRAIPPSLRACAEHQRGVRRYKRRPRRRSRSKAAETV